MDTNNEPDELDEQIQNIKQSINNGVKENNLENVKLQFNKLDMLKSYIEPGSFSLDVLFASSICNSILHKNTTDFLHTILENLKIHNIVPTDLVMVSDNEIVPILNVDIDATIYHLLHDFNLNDFYTFEVFKLLTESGILDELKYDENDEQINDKKGYGELLQNVLMNAAKNSVKNKEKLNIDAYQYIISHFFVNSGQKLEQMNNMLQELKLTN
jgi:hypothetical protein